MNEQTIFTGAIKRDPAERSPFPDSVGGVDQELRETVEELPHAQPMPVSSCVMDGGALVALFRTLCLVREIDRHEQDFVRRGEAFFHVSGAGHEASAATARHLTDDDWLHLHYRDKALMLALGVPIREFFLSLFCKANSHSAGRQMSAHLSDPSHRVLSLVGPVGVAAAIKHQTNSPIIVCTSTNRR